MERLNVNPTKMVLTSLKKKLFISRRGHKMLKDKRDEMMKQFIIILQEAKTLRKIVESRLLGATQNFALQMAEMEAEDAHDLLINSSKFAEIEIKKKSIMSVSVPRFELSHELDVGYYSLLTTPGDIDISIRELKSVGRDMIKLAELEKGLEMLAAELEKVRRRVNALEYVTIPQLVETIRYIIMKLEEGERSSRTRLIKLKDMLLEQKYKKVK
ncbi:MAG: V-type ATP synthase subunit D [Fusobacteria bacterium]|nr:V-type ATP synthase subunit D [Fusobacteriota bacterium]